MSGEQTQVSTGCAGLDKILGGGLPQGHAYLVSGQPGTGKTTLCLQFLLTGLRRGERALYVTLSQTEAELRGIAASHGFELDSENFAVLELRPSHLANAAASRQTILPSAEVELAELVEATSEAVREHKPDRLVFDSLVEMQLISGTELRFRRELAALQGMLVDAGITSVVIDSSGDVVESTTIEAIFHGAIRFDFRMPSYGAAQRRLAITKLRGQKFVEGYHDVDIVAGGLRLFPRVVSAAAPTGEVPDRAVIGSGMKGLDSICGGGFETGTSLLITGQSGTGKSTLATAFARGAAGAGLPCAVFLFEEEEEMYRRRAHDLGLSIEGDAFRDIRIQRIDPGDVSAGRVVEMAAQSTEAGARVVVLDSVTGFLAALSDFGNLASQLHGLISFLKRRGVLVILILNQHGLMAQEPTVDLDFSFIADAVVMLRQYQHGGAIRRTVSVLKKRYGPHSVELREMRLDAETGIKVRALDVTSVARDKDLGSG